MTRTTAPGTWNRVDAELEDTLETSRTRPVRVVHPRATGRCVYCGGWIWPRSRACWAHRDLLAVDPYFSPESRTTTIPSSAGGFAPRQVGTPTQNKPAGRTIPSSSIATLLAGSSLLIEERNE